MSYNFQDYNIIKYKNIYLWKELYFLLEKADKVTPCCAVLQYKVPKILKTIDIKLKSEGGKRSLSTKLIIILKKVFIDNIKPSPLIQ